VRAGRWKPTAGSRTVQPALASLVAKERQVLVLQAIVLNSSRKGTLSAFGTLQSPASKPCIGDSALR